MMQTKEGVTFKTYDGEFTAKKKNRCTFCLPEFDTHKKVTFDVVSDDLHLRQESPYDAIIGLDIMGALGMDIQFSDKTIRWDGETVSMKESGSYKSRKAMEAAYKLATRQGVPILEEQMGRQAKILDADYSKVGVNEMVDQMDNISLNFESNN